MKIEPGRYAAEARSAFRRAQAFVLVRLIAYPLTLISAWALEMGTSVLAEELAGEYERRQMMDDTPARERELVEEPTTCHNCGAKPGETHLAGCDVSRCSVCGGQRLQCELVGSCEDHDPRLTFWTGYWLEGEAIRADIAARRLRDVVEALIEHLRGIGPEPEPDNGPRWHDEANLEGLKKAVSVLESSSGGGTMAELLTTSEALIRLGWTSRWLAVSLMESGPGKERATVPTRPARRIS